MSHQKEIERKFLVKFPKSWTDLASLFEDLLDIERIHQIYLVPEKDQPSARVRKTIKGLAGKTKTIFHFNRKKPLDTGVHHEEEREISSKEFDRLSQHPYPNKQPVDKIRFVFKYQDQIFELDVFQGALKGLAILELELEHKNDPIELPPFLKIVKEITSDKRYSNFSLASVK